MSEVVSVESGCIEEEQFVSGGCTMFSVQLGKLTPPKEKSAKIRGKGSIAFSGNHLMVKGQADGGGLVILCTVLATILTAVVVVAVAQAAGFAAGPGAIVWYLIFQASLKRDVCIVIYSDKRKAYYMQKRRIACIELPDGRWIAVRCLSGDDATLLQHLQEAYGDRLALGK